MTLQGLFQLQNMLYAALKHQCSASAPLASAAYLTQHSLGGPVLVSVQPQTEAEVPS